MTKRKQYTLILIPILILIGWVIYHEFHILTGTSVRFNIQGYDPRNLLSGHYLTYQVEYPEYKHAQCKQYRKMQNKVFLNVETGELSPEIKDQGIWLAGKCYSQFYANINRFYIPQEHAKKLDEFLRTGEFPASIEVIITNSGHGYVKELYFDNIKWQTFLKNSDTIEQNSESLEPTLEGQGYQQDNIN